MTPLVLLHGFTGSPRSFAAVLDRLPGTPALCPALLGHGAAAPFATSFDAEAERLLSLLPPEPVVLAGYSLGARLALRVATLDPLRVRHLVLVGAHPGLATDGERAERRAGDARWAALLRTEGLASFVRAWEAQPLFASQAELAPGLREARRTERLGHDAEALARSLEVLGLGSMPDQRPHLPGLDVPVTVMAGELDTKFLALGQSLAAALPRATLRLAPGAGHDLLLERPDRVADALDSALKGRGPHE